MTRHLLHASGYGGTIYTLALDPVAQTLAVTSQVQAGKAPTWIHLAREKDMLYTGDEFADVGTLHAFKVDSEGALELSSTKKTGQGKSSTGPVHIAIKGNQLYTSNYAGASLSSIRLEEDNTFRKTDREDELLKFVGAGPKTDRQEAPHPHGVFLDPTGDYLVCADLGADTLRVFKTSQPLEKSDQAHITPGAGPRHLLFSPPPASSPKSPTLCYLVNELSNTVAVFEVVYPASRHDHLKFKAVGKSDISFLPQDREIKGDWTGAELAITPDRKHLFVSNRSSDDPQHQQENDLLAVFKLKDNGQIITTEPPAFKDLGGRGPRHFSLSPASEGQEEGAFVAFGLQKTNEVVVFKRSGGDLEEVARVKDIKEPTCVIWD